MKAFKDNQIYRLIIIPICIIMAFFFKFIPIQGLSRDAVGLIFIFISSLILWLTIGIDWPSLLCLCALGFLDSFGFAKTFTSSFGNSTWIFLLFTFLITYAISKTPLIKRISLFFIDNKIARKNGYLFISLFLFSVLLLGLFIAPSVLFIVMLPILLEILNIAGINKGDKCGKVLMLGLGFSVSISSGMTTIAHVFPVLALSAANTSMNAFQYMGFAIPTGLIIFILMLVMFFIYLKKEDINKLKNIDVSNIKKDLPKINKEEIICLVVFISVILLWIIPSIFKDIAPDFYNAINNYTTIMPPLIGVILLCIIRVNNKPILNIIDGFKNGLPFGALLMCAATLALGSALSSDAIGLKTAISNGIGGWLSSLPSIAILIIFVIWSLIQTNLSSNMVTATLVASVAGVIITSSVNLKLPLVAALIGMLASFAFATPPSMPHIALVSSSEYATGKDTLIFGSILMIISGVITLLVGYPLGLLIV